MAGTLSRIAQHGCWILAAGCWLAVVAPALGDEGVRVAPTARMIENPFSTPAAPAGTSATGTAEPQRAPVARPSVTPSLPEAGPRMYQNPFAAQPSSSLEVMPLGPGPISRWRPPIRQPQAMIPDGLTEPLDLIQRAPRPLGTVPPTAALPAGPPNPFTNNHGTTDAPYASVPERDVLTPEALAQPTWLLPDDGPTSLGTPDELLGPTRPDPFDVADQVASQPTVPVRQPTDALQFVPPERDVVRAAALETAFDIDLPDTGPAERPPAEPQDWLARAQQAAGTADTPAELSALVVLCRQGIAADMPRDQRQSLRELAAWALNRRGELASVAGRNEAALDDFQAAISLDPDCWLALHNRAVSYAQQNRTIEALQDFNRVIELNPGLAMAYRNRGELLGSLGRTEEAVHDYTQAIAQLPGDADLYVMRGHAWHRLGRYDRALADLDQSIKLHPVQPGAYTNRGNVHAERGDYGEAIADFRHALQLDPNWVEAYRSLAWLLATCPDPTVCDPQQAVAAARRAAALAPPDDCYVLDALAAAYASAGQFATAVKYQQQALTAGPDDFVPSLRDRLELYQQHQPYRNAAPSGVQPAAYEDDAPVTISDQPGQ